MKWHNDFEFFINNVFFNVVSEGIIMYDAKDNKVLYHNKKAINLLNISERDNLKITSILCRKFKAVLKGQMSDNEDISFEKVVKPDGQGTLPIRMTATSSIFDNILVIRLGTDQHFSENLNNNYSFLFRHSDKIVTVINNQASIEYVNGAFLENFKLNNTDEVLGKNLFVFGTHFDKFQVIRIWKTISEGMSWKGEINITSINDEPLYLFANIIPLKNGRFIIIADDITTQKTAEIKLQEAEQKKNIILSAMPDTILVIEKKGLITQYKCEEGSSLFKNMPVIDKYLNEIGLPSDLCNKINNAIKFTLKSKKIKHFNYALIPLDKHYECRVVALNDSEVILIVRDITKRTIGERLMKNKEKSYKSMIENFPSGLIIQKNNRLYYANKTALKYVGCKTLKDLRKFNIFDLLPEDKREMSRKRVNDALEGKNVQFMEFPIMNIATGKYFMYETKPVLFDYYGEKVCQVVIRDLSVQKKLIKETLRAEMAENLNILLKKEMLIRRKAEDEIKNSLKEKEELIKEIHHRVKNNMQVMTSIFNLQKNMIDNLEMKKIFEESQNRIKSMALVHENIYSNKSLTKIDFESYIRSLCENLIRSYELTESNIEIVYKIKNFYLPVTLAVPCGLILNEIISFSINNFFVEISKKVCIFVEANLNNNEVYIQIANNGSPIKDKKILNNPRTLGFQLVSALVDQLNGRITLDITKQNNFSLFFNI
jgi:PAS domain S-box-containing protein